MTRVGQYAYLLKRLHNTSRLVPSARLFLHRRELLAKNGLGDEENFGSGEPVPSFLKIIFIACDYLLMITPPPKKKKHWHFGSVTKV